MKVTRLGPPRPILNSGFGYSYSVLPPAGAAGTVLTSNGSNGSAWGENVARITSNGSNTLLGPYVNFASGSNTVFSVTSNTLTINALATGASSSLTVKDEGTPLATDATSLDFVGAGVTASGAGATKTITIPGGSGGTTIRGFLQVAEGQSGVGTPTLTWGATPASTSVFVLIMCVNGGGPTSITQTNVTWTLLDSTNYGGVGETDVWKGIPTGTPGTSTTFTGAAGALSAALAVEVASATTVSLVAGGRISQTSTGNTRGPDNNIAIPAVGSLVVCAVHTAGANAVGMAVLSCPFIAKFNNSGQALSIGSAVGLPVTFVYANAGSQDFTLAEIAIS